jgi:hypothetical protein
LSSSNGSCPLNATSQLLYSSTAKQALRQHTDMSTGGHGQRHHHHYHRCLLLRFTQPQQFYGISFHHLSPESYQQSSTIILK